MLIADGSITEEQLNEALAAQNERDDLLGAILISLGYIDEEILLDCLRRQGTIVKAKTRRDRA